MWLLERVDRVAALIVGLAALALILNKESSADKVINDVGDLFTTLLRNMVTVPTQGATGTW